LHGGSTISRRARGSLILPHPEMHQRPFVLVPLHEVDRHWRHPVLGLKVATLIVRLGPATRASIRQILDFAASACDKGPG